MSKRSVRPLGQLKHINTSNDKIPKFPALSSIQNNNGLLNKDYELHGNAMSVPPPKEPEEPKQKSVVKSAKSDSGSSTKSLDLVDRKELNEAKAREKELREKVASLEKLIEELRAQLREKDQLIVELQEKLADTEKHFKKLYEVELQSHAETKTNLRTSQDEAAKLTMQLEHAMQENSEKLKQLQEESDRKLAEMTAVKDKEIADKEQKLNRLKQQMADALKGNSWERQQQLEELTKELRRIQDEADSLRHKLKAYKSKSSCANCAENAAKMDKAVAVVKDKDIQIKEMNQLLAKFEKQLSQQDHLLKTWAESKGHKVTTFPK
ncbi:hypothetical protein CHS0354_030721 [Potamilus streckersoni]|uniref:Uncharacterized protein n=1 Tax=Potamilus streckersoni TaxID=2493646 RepID=A0AAE0VYM6_9BIVA|nr:hypothetical protein CHS0354_030721 [Potamilus streckersoni]